MIENDGGMGRVVFAFVASTAGAITSLGFMNLKTMTRVQIFLAFFTSFSFAFFFSPVVIVGVQSWTDQPRLQGAIYWLLATGSQTFITLAVKWGSRLFGFQQETPK